jgi:hypothetical protein
LSGATLTAFKWNALPQCLPRMNSTEEDQMPITETGRVTKAFLKMKKFDIAALRRAFEGRE